MQTAGILKSGCHGNDQIYLINKYEHQSSCFNIVSVLCTEIALALNSPTAIFSNVCQQIYANLHRINATVYATTPRRNHRRFLLARKNCKKCMSSVQIRHHYIIISG